MSELKLAPIDLQTQNNNSNAILFYLFFTNSDILIKNQNYFILYQYEF
jgi:hypothetical protein